MAAPSTTVWGSAVKNTSKGWEGKIGINTSTVNNSSGVTTTVTVQVWFWSEYAVDDGSNSYYFDNEAKTATTLRADVDIKTTTNSAWSTNNQILLNTYTYTYSRTSSNAVKYCAAKLSGIDALSGLAMTVYTSYTIPAITSYTISYNANGGTGAPSAQTKQHGAALTLSSTTPIRSGYTFLGWSTSSSATSATYAAGASFTSNATTTLYAVWSSSSYVVTYNANGGSGAPASQTKKSGVALTLSSTTPTRTNYTFVGWGTSASATNATYQPGGSYTANASITLYAIWKSNLNEPRIENLKIYRCSSSNASTPPTADDSGTNCYVHFDWATDYTPTKIQVFYTATDSESSGELYTVYASSSEFPSNELADRQGTVTLILGSSYYGEAGLDPNKNYDIRIRVLDEKTTTDITRFLPGIYYTIDFLSGGKGVAIGKQAENEGLEISMNTDINAALRVNGNPVLTSSNYSSYALPLTGGTTTGYVKLGNTINAVGCLRQHTDYIGFFTSPENAQANTSRLGWIGYNATSNFSVVNGQTGGSNITNKAWTTVSDRRLKNDVVDLDGIYVDVWNELLPKVFRWNELNSNDSHLHFGLIAQDVIEAFEKHGLDYEDYGFVNSFTLPEDDTEYYGIAYDEYHMLTSLVVRKQQEKINSLEERIEKLEKLILGQEE